MSFELDNAELRLWPRGDTASLAPERKPEPLAGKTHADAYWLDDSGKLKMDRAILTRMVREICYPVEAQPGSLSVLLSPRFVQKTEDDLVNLQEFLRRRELMRNLFQVQEIEIPFLCWQDWQVAARLYLGAFGLLDEHDMSKRVYKQLEAFITLSFDPQTGLLLSCVDTSRELAPKEAKWAEEPHAR